MDEHAGKRRSFEGKDDQARWQHAAGYADQWLAAGKSECNCFCVCRSGGANNSDTVIASNVWARMKDDPTAAGQRWYCIGCGAMCKCSCGLLLLEVVDRLKRARAEALP